MFKELAPYLRQRAVLLTVTHFEEDQIRVNIIPKKLKDGENNALTTPLTVTGTAEELDRDLPSTIVSFVSSHLQLKNTLDRAQADMDAAAKAATAEAKKKVVGKKEPAKPETVKSDVASKCVTPSKPEPPKPVGLFDKTDPEVAARAGDPMDEENGTLAEGEQADDQDDDELDEAA
jgi:PRTRC genetic system protein E